MALALRTLTGMVRTTTWVDEVFAFGNGVLDGYMLEGVSAGVWIVLLKSLLIPILDKTVVSLPRGLVHSAEAILGFIVGILIAPRR